jgi:hypothetical protein
MHARFVLFQMQLVSTAQQPAFLTCVDSLHTVTLTRSNISNTVAARDIGLPSHYARTATRVWEKPADRTKLQS